MGEAVDVRGPDFDWAHPGRRVVPDAGVPEVVRAATPRGREGCESCEQSLHDIDINTAPWLSPTAQGMRRAPGSGQTLQHEENVGLGRCCCCQWHHPQPHREGHVSAMSLFNRWATGTVTEWATVWGRLWWATGSGDKVGVSVGEGGRR